MNGRKGLWRALGVLAAVALGTGAASAQAAKPVAVVNGEPVRAAEVEAILKHQPPSPTPLTEAQRRQNQKAAVELLVDDLIMKQFLSRQFAGKPGFAPNSPEVNKQFAEFVGSLKQQKQTLAQFLQETGQTEDQVRAEIVTKLQWKAYVTANLREADLQKYYEVNKPFFDKVLVHASHILVRMPADAKPADRQAGRQKLTALRQDILAGKIDFAEAAKKYSDCPSKVNGGDIGFFPRKFHVLEPFAQAAFALPVGQVSDVVETEYGLHLIKVLERSPGEPSTYDKVKEAVQSVCATELWDAILTREHRTAKVQINLP
jgi:parvulin-like peptidyl-prolyl isomerase